jgi:hypothetical protein
MHRWATRQVEQARCELRAEGEEIGEIAAPACPASLSRHRLAREGSKRRWRRWRTRILDDGVLCSSLRRFFDIDESRLRAKVYLHEGLDLDAAEEHWSGVTDIPRPQFGKAYRPEARSGLRHTKHEFGCAYVFYACAPTHRRIMGLVRALLASGAIPG